MKEKLIEFGLSPHESDVYLYLLKNMGKKANEIAKETKINRSVIYTVLEKLIDKGLVNYNTKDSVRRFSSNKPSALMDFIKDKERMLYEFLPSLNMLKKEDKEKVSVEIFEGVNGGIVVLKDIIREGKDYVSIGDEGVFQTISKTQVEQYVRQLEENKIKERIITQQGTKLIVGKHTEIRYLPKDLHFPTITTIYGDKVAIAIFEKPYYVVLIKSKSLALTYRTLFEFMWKIAKE